MKITIETSDPKVIDRVAKADDMAYFIWELVHNLWRQFKHMDDSEYSYHDVWEAISESLELHNINIDSLVGE